MRCNLKVGSWFCGENTSVNGTIEVDGQTYELDCHGDASSRGTHAKVDGEAKWWCGPDHPGSEGPQNVEQAVEDLFESVWNQVDEQGDAEEGWVATVVDGKVTNIEWEPDEDEDE